MHSNTLKIFWERNDRIFFFWNFSSFFGFYLILVERRGLVGGRELEDNVLAGQVLVHAGECVQTIAVGLVFVVEVHFEELGAVLADACALANNLRGEDQVVEDGLVDGRQGAAAGAQLLELARVARFLAQDAALGDDDDRLAGELLLEFLDQGAFLDHLLELSEHGDRDEDDNALLATADVDFLGRCDVYFPERALELVRVDLQLVDGLGNILLQAVGRGALCLLDLRERSDFFLIGPHGF